MEYNEILEAIKKLSLEDLTKLKSEIDNLIQLMKEPFSFEECGKCSNWSFSIKCKKTSSIYLVTVNKCVTEDKYTFDTTKITGEDCPKFEDTIEVTKEKIESYLNGNFYKMEELVCVSFVIKNEICPDCQTSAVAGEI